MDYVVGIKVYYGAGVDGTESAKGTVIGKVYCGSQCKTDFGDIRFTALDGLTELDYWMEEKSDSNYAYFWVKIPLIPLSPDTVKIYVYYGNSSAATTSDGDATFIIFDDFDGGALDPAKWDEVLGGNTRVVEDSKLKVNITAGADYRIDSKSAYDFPDNVEIMFYIDINGMAPPGILTVQWVAIDRIGVVATWGGGWYDESAAWDRRIYGTSASWWPGAGRGAGLGESRHAMGTRDDDYFDWFCEGVKNFNDTLNNANRWPTDDARYLRYRLKGNNAVNADLFWIAVRKGTLNIPTHTAWETLSQIIGSFDVAHSDSEDVPAGFAVRQGSRDLAAEFEVGGTQDDSEELLAGFQVGQGSQQLSGAFIVQQSASQDLPAGLQVRQLGSQEFLGELIVRQSGSEELLGELVVRQPGSVNLLAGFAVGQPGSEELPAAFEVGQGDRNVPGEFVVRGAASQNLVAELVVRQAASQDLGASFDGQVSLNLLGELIVRHPGSEEFLAGLISRQAALQELAAGFAVRHTATLELKAGFKVATYSVDLLGNIYVRPTGSRATDFVVKDNTRGLTVRDVDRVMMVTPRRRMKVR
ncbi:hypothetical protein LCGC14_1090220 [marine sediment metagenome]|uniref:DUF2341 domain-containing protein n=1 Tax=marine sediment metagenome TaxID=412755 RepID=A0A0F9MH28_9ZZZZ